MTENYMKKRIDIDLFKNKTLLITGGTGSFGNAVLNRFIQTDIGQIRIFSRDEKNQDDMRHEVSATRRKNQVLHRRRTKYYGDSI